MYHHRQVRPYLFWSLFVAASACACFIQPQSGLAKSNVLINETSESLSSSEWPVVPAKLALHDKPQQLRIYQLNNEPLGLRTPLLLVHGLRGEYRRLFRWDKLVKKLNDDDQFRQTYKIYLARYDSTEALEKSIPQFKTALLNLSASANKDITVLSLSLGGNLVYHAMQDPQVDNSIKYLFAMGTPFHGSPLFSPDWFQYSLYKNLSYPLTRIDHSLSYRLYFKHNPNLLHDLKWDNADGYIPEVGKFKSRLLFGPSGDLTVARDSNQTLFQINQNTAINKRKLITYSGYLINPYILPSLRRQFETTILAPYTFATIMVPAHLAREHPVLKMLNREISRVLPGPSAPRVSNWPHMYGLNDGITPVGSAIFLSADSCRQYPLAREADLSKVKQSVDVKLARVFRNIDHLTFVDNYRPHHGPRLLRDQFNTKADGRRMFDWILSDLMDLESTTSEVAKELNVDSTTDSKN